MRTRSGIRVKRAIEIALLAAAVVGCAACHHEQAAETAQSVNFDDRQWTAVQKNARKRAGGDYVREYLPPGQTVTDWREIITVEEFSTAMAKKPISARDFADQIVEQLKKDDPQLLSNLSLPSSVTDVKFTWKGVDKKLGNAEGVVRVVERPPAIDVIQYTVRPQMSEKQSRKWWDILSQADAAKL